MDVIQSNPDILGGTSVFKGTRVPIQTLFDYLEEGSSLDDFLKDYPTVKKQQAISVLEIAGKVVSSKDFKLPHETAP
ncbi:DUF433 domain-containing protein [Gracilimonas mengyeensis]|uniref:Uncharacterized conserved protein, DUF433 family n=1 Tax=Gracilimonas mengyeensis TaxID=1302730 RepID=A0A521BC40_9BACT|nr:DUF433 domain-containing protein [Gracilimonas mengyeensis]SMO44695.1 Uncharacterized conserved protein, DUF433 family [Gracilimonas mengyeensis]